MPAILLIMVSPLRQANNGRLLPEIHPALGVNF